MRRSARAGTGGLPRRTEALRRADAEEDRDEALWRSAPRARAADAMAQPKRTVRRIAAPGRGAAALQERVVGRAEPDLMGIGEQRL